MGEIRIRLEDTTHAELLKIAKLHHVTLEVLMNRALKDSLLGCARLRMTAEGIDLPRGGR